MFLCSEAYATQQDCGARTINTLGPIISGDGQFSYDLKTTIVNTCPANCTISNIRVNHLFRDINGVPAGVHTSKLFDRLAYKEVREIDAIGIKKHPVPIDTSVKVQVYSDWECA